MGQHYSPPGIRLPILFSRLLRRAGDKEGFSVLRTLMMSGFRIPSLIEQALLPPGEDEIHLAFGLGLAFESFQLDLGVDLSDHVDTASLSAIYSF